MKLTRIAKVYLIVSLVLFVSFTFAGVRKYRFLTAISAATWTASGPGLRHK